MLDVHPPEHTPHTWRDFFIHIATICVGLLIAIGLEQTLEAIHRHHERTELLQALNRESQQIIRNSAACLNEDRYFFAWNRNEVAVVKSNLVNHTPYTGLPTGTLPEVAADMADDPVYKAAKASGKLALLSDAEIADFGELDEMISREFEAAGHLHESEAALNDSLYIMDLYRSKNGPQNDSMPDPRAYSPVPPEDLRQLYVALGQSRTAQEDLYFYERAAGGAAGAILKGERNLSNIQNAERPSRGPQPSPSAN